MKYLTEEQLIQINTRIIKRYTPKELIGIREPAALNAVIEAPKATAFGEEAYPTIFEKSSSAATWDYREAAISKRQ